MEKETAVRHGHGGPEKAGDCLKVTPCSPVQAGMWIQRPECGVSEFPSISPCVSVHGVPLGVSL